MKPFLFLSLGLALPLYFLSVKIANNAQKEIDEANDAKSEFEEQVKSLMSDILNNKVTLRRVTRMIKESKVISIESTEIINY